MVGTLIHKIYEEALKGDRSQLDQIIKTNIDEYEKQWREHEGIVHARYTPSNLETLVKVSVEKDLSLFPYKFHKDFVEIGFSLPLTEDGSVLFTGRYDANVSSLDEQTWYVYDLKTTQRLGYMTRERWAMSSQFTGYLYALQRLMPEKNIGGILVNALEINSLPIGEPKKCSVHKVPKSICRLLHVNKEIHILNRGHHEIEAWRNTFLKAVPEFRRLIAKRESKNKWSQATMDRLKVQGTFNGSCGFCSFKEFCSTGRRIDFLKNTTVESTWAPFTVPELEGD